MRTVAAAGLALVLAAATGAPAMALGPATLGVVYRAGDPDGERAARAYQRIRGVPDANVVAIPVRDAPVLDPTELVPLRAALRARLPAGTEAVLLVWSRPYAVGCMSVTTAVAAGWRAEFCEPGCAATAASPLFDAATTLAAREDGWLPAMLMPADPALAAELARRGVRADGSRPAGTVYLVATGDAARNVRAAGYDAVARTVGGRLVVQRLAAPIVEAPVDAIAYFTGSAVVAELGRVRFRPGAAADHLTSVGGALDQRAQTTAVEWLRAGATASYGTVSEPCNHRGKFPEPGVFLRRYLAGDTLLEAYWKSVLMPGQGLFVGEPLAAPYAVRPSAGTPR